MAQASGTLVSGTFTGTGSSDHLVINGGAQFQLSGFGTATVKPEASLDNGTTWGDITLPDGTTAATYTASRGCVPLFFQTPTAVRLTCSAYTSGTIAYRLQRTATT